ncbi:hypothetical protein SAMN02910368_00709 [Lachnospiraceae bacterium G11]|nr:hypothetical protein SAMN02910368_00709 [Lachnospiraceae bacterium G11]
MKKKLLKFTGLFITFIMVMWFAGCGNKTAETSETNPGDNQTAETSAGTETETLTEEPAKEPEHIETYALTQGYNGDLIYIIDSEGNKLKTIDRADIAKNVPDNEKEQYRFASEETYMRCTLAAEGDGFLFFSDTVPGEDSDQYEHSVFAVKEDDLKIYPIAKIPNEHYVISTDYYEGALFVDFSFGYGENNEYLGVGEKKFVYDENTDVFTEKDSEYNGVFESAKVMGVRLNGTTRVMGYSQDSFTRTMHECGFILGSTDNGYAMVDDRGAVTPLVNFEEGYINMYSKGHMFFINSSYDTGVAEAFIYDVDGKALNQISDDWSLIQSIGRNGNDYYYYTQDEESYGIKINHVFKYNAESGLTTALYEAKSIPGVSIQPGVEDFQLCGDKMYAICYDDGATKWMRIDSSNGVATYTDIDCPVSTVDIFNYGKISSTSIVDTCPNCGTPLVKIYAERFELDSKYSKNADKINETLKDVQDRELSYSTDGDDYYGSDCTEHQEHPTWYTITDDYTVSAVKIINDKYLAVDMGGYWYGGGAHGMPMRDQHLFDLETGEEKTLEDFYTMTNEDFKALVAYKTKEDFLKYENGESPYFAADADTVFNDAYEYAELDRGTVDFAEDGIYYYYPPYEMGPYAAGYIDVFISYEELLGREEL